MLSADRAPAVSIVVPTRNRAELLSAALESVLAQDYPRLEVVVVDDGSEDETANVIAAATERASGRLRSTRHPNRGFVRSLNRGFELAGGELYGILPDDDLLRPGAVSTLVAALDANPAAPLAHCAYDQIDDGGEVIATVTPPPFDLAEALRLYWMTVAGPGALFRREAFDRVGGWDPELRWTADFDFWLRVGRLGPFVLVEEPLAAKRVHPGADSTRLRGPEKARDRVRVVEKFYEAEDLSERLLAVRDEAHRAAYIDAAISAAAGHNREGERFYVADRLVPRLEGTPESDLHGQIAELRMWSRDLVEAIRQRDERIADQDARIRELDRHVGALERSLAGYRRMVPARLRALGRRLL